MGDNFLKQQAENFRKRRDLGMEELHAPKLFTRPEVFEREFAISPDQGEHLTAGETLMVAADTSAGCVAIARRSRRVGTVHGEGALVLMDALADEDTPGIALLEVFDVSELSGAGRARLAGGRHQDE